jgi:putative endonuclease
MKLKPIRKSQRCYFVYIVSSLSGTLYVGLTDDLRKRIIEHQNGSFDGFTKKYKINRLMYYEFYTDPLAGEKREKQVKKFRREKKVALFRESNPEWKDLASEIFQSIGTPRYARDFRAKLGGEAVS